MKLPDSSFECQYLSWKILFMQSLDPCLEYKYMSSRCFLLQSPDLNFQYQYMSFKDSLYQVCRPELPLYVDCLQDYIYKLCRSEHPASMRLSITINVLKDMLHTLIRFELWVSIHVLEDSPHTVSKLLPPVWIYFLKDSFYKVVRPAHRVSIWPSVSMHVRKDSLLQVSRSEFPVQSIYSWILLLKYPGLIVQYQYGFKCQ